MEETIPNAHFRRAGILVIVVLVSLIFLWMIRGFITPLFLAAVFTHLSHRLYQRLCIYLGGRAKIASAATIALLSFIVIVPLVVLLGVVANQAYQVSQDVMPWVERVVQTHDSGSMALPDWIPLHDRVSSSQIAAKLGEFAGTLGELLFDSLSTASKGTAMFFLDLFIMLYAMYFFYLRGGAIMDRMLSLLPLPRDARQRLFDKGVSVARATIKGTIVIGVIQGALGGLAFAVAGLNGAALWGSVMALASVIPGVGTALVWVPAVVFLAMTGQTQWALALGIWFVAVVGTVDNVLRPKLVGGDTQMPDLLILISTLGGLALFGVARLILGPFLAAMVIILWDVYEATFVTPADDTR